MRILGISGSLRRGSHNRTLLRAASAELPTGVDLIEWDGLAGLPAFNEDLERPLRVLRYLPTNLRGPEIASELFVSQNTIRAHLRNLYAKLGVHSRTDAVNRARELGLLSPSSLRR